MGWSEYGIDGLNQGGREDCGWLLNLSGLIESYYYSDCVNFTAMSWDGTKLVLNGQDVEEGQLPNCGNPQPNNVPFQHIDYRRKHYYNEERPHNPTAETAPDQHLLPEQPPLQHPAPYSQMEYETIPKKNTPKDCSRSPDKKKKSHKGEHKSRHHHRSHNHEKDREKQINKYDWKDNQKETYTNEKRRNNGEGSVRNEGALDGPKEAYYPPPYYPPYMYTPPPPNMYPYQMPPHYMPPGSYPYGGIPMMPPVNMAPPPPGYHPVKGALKNEYPPGHDEAVGLPPFRGPEREITQQEDAVVDRPGEGDYKMFGMGGHYMYPYPPPPVGYPGYPGYPPPGYMMYPPEPYYPGGEQDDQLQSWRRRQLVDNQKQRVRKALKHLSQELKIEMLDTVRIVMKLEKKATRTPNSQSLQSSDHHDDAADNLQGTTDKCYQRNIFKLERWLREDDNRTRQAARHLVMAMQMEGLEDRIRDVREERRAETESLQSVAKRLLDRLIISRRQVVF